MQQDGIKFNQIQNALDELGSLYHNTISRVVEEGRVVIEPRPTFKGTEFAAGYGRGVTKHKGEILRVTSEAFTTPYASTVIADTEINPHCNAAFARVASGNDRLTIIQNAGDSVKYGNIYYGSNAPSLQVDSYIADGITALSSGVNKPQTDTGGMCMDTTGLRMYVVDQADGYLYQYDLSTPYDTSTLSFVQRQLLNATDYVDISIQDDGRSMYCLRAAGVLDRYLFGTYFDISTLPSTADQSKDLTANVAALTGRGLAISASGASIYILDDAHDKVEQWTMTVPWSLVSVPYASKSLDHSSQTTTPAALAISPSGTVLYVGQDNPGYIYEYTLSTAGDLSTGSYASRVNQDIFSHYLRGLFITVAGAFSATIEHATTGDCSWIDFVEDGAWTKVTDADSPGTPSSTYMIHGVVALNGYIFVADVDGNIYNCNNNGGTDITAWDALDVINAERKPDYGCAIIEHKDHVVYIGTKSIEFFYDAANATGSPLSRRQDVYYNIGCMFPNSVTHQGDTTYFFGTDSEGETDIHILDNFQLKPMGDEYIKTLLRQLTIEPNNNIYTTDPTNFKQHLVAYTTPNNGTCLLLTINGSTYNICLNSGHISQWYPGNTDATTTGIFSGDWEADTIFPIVSIYNVSASGLSSGTTVQFANGQISNMAYNSDLIDVFADSAAPCFMYTKKWNAGTLNRKKISAIRIHQYPAMDSSLTTSNITLEWVDKENANEIGAALTDASFTISRTIDLLYSSGNSYRYGTTRERLFKITFTPEKSQLLEGMEIEFEALRN